MTAINDTNLYLRFKLSRQQAAAVMLMLHDTVNYKDMKISRNHMNVLIHSIRQRIRRPIINCHWRIGYTIDADGREWLERECATA